MTDGHFLFLPKASTFIFPAVSIAFIFFSLGIRRRDLLRHGLLMQLEDIICFYRMAYLLACSGQLGWHSFPSLGIWRLVLAGCESRFGMKVVIYKIYIHGCEGNRFLLPSIFICTVQCAIHSPFGNPATRLATVWTVIYEADLSGWKGAYFFYVKLIFAIQYSLHSLPPQRNGRPVLSNLNNVINEVDVNCWEPKYFLLLC